MTTPIFKRYLPYATLPDDWYMDENHDGWDVYGVKQISGTKFAFYRDSDDLWAMIENQGFSGDIETTLVKGNDGHGFMKTSFGPGQINREFYTKREFTFHNKSDAALFKLTFL